MMEGQHRGKHIAAHDQRRVYRLTMLCSTPVGIGRSKTPRRRRLTLTARLCRRHRQLRPNKRLRTPRNPPKTPLPEPYNFDA